MRHPTRTTIIGLTAALALSAGATSPAGAGVEDDLHSLDHQHASGSVRSPDGTLEKGCQTHPYRYRVKAGSSDWSLEVFLVDPDGTRVANGYEVKGADRARGRGRFEFCAQPTRPGTFTIKSRLTWQDGEYHDKWLAPRTIQLHRD